MTSHFCTLGLGELQPPVTNILFICPKNTNWNSEGNGCVLSFVNTRDIFILEFLSVSYLSSSGLSLSSTKRRFLYFSSAISLFSSSISHSGALPSQFSSWSWYSSYLTSLPHLVHSNIVAMSSALRCLKSSPIPILPVKFLSAVRAPSLHALLGLLKPRLKAISSERSFSL